MLQMEDVMQRACGKLGPRPMRLSGAALAAYIDQAIAEAQVERSRLLQRQGMLSRAIDGFDHLLRTDEQEYLDDPSCSDAVKLRIVRGVHLMNVLTFSYQRFLRVLAPQLLRVARDEHRPLRLLELAGGTGGFALALAQLAIRNQVPVTVTGSDVVPAFVDRARAEATRRHLPVAFEVIDATTLENIDEGSFDVVFVAQSMHHFSPGMLGTMIAEARRIARHSFVGIDGYRSLGMIGFVTGSAALSLHGPSLHDAWITARRFYAHPELRLIAELAAPDARVTTRRSLINTILEVEFSPDATSA